MRSRDPITISDVRAWVLDVEIIANAVNRGSGYELTFVLVGDRLYLRRRWQWVAEQHHMSLTRARQIYRGGVTALFSEILIRDLAPQPRG